MASDISICSNALSKLGAKPITSFTDDSDHAELCKALYPTVRDDVMRSHYWNCAIKRVLLAPLVGTPAFDFTYQYQLPGDWLRTVQVGRKEQSLEYRSEGKRILADVNPLPLVYIANISEADMSSNLVSLMEKSMEVVLAYPVTTSVTLKQELHAEYKDALKLAKAIDGQDDPPEEFAEGSYSESRY